MKTQAKLTSRLAARYQRPMQASKPRSLKSVNSNSSGADPVSVKPRNAKFGIGQVVRHRKYPFRGIIYDVDPVFANTEEWWLAIPEEVRPRKDQPFYHLFAENAETEYVAYVSEQNLLPDTSGDPVRHPQVEEMFTRAQDGGYQIKTARLN
jgi:heat shock protein HspQ